MSHARDRAFESLTAGEKASFERTITEADIRTFAELSGDHNPLHTDDAYAATTPFGARVVHGMFIGALVSRLVGMHLPGKRALLVKESLEFKKPVHIGDTVKVEGVIARMSSAMRIIELDIRICVKDTVAAIGQVHVQVRDA